jgi:hypothetical protein
VALLSLQCLLPSRNQTLDSVRNETNEDVVDRERPDCQGDSTPENEMHEDVHKSIYRRKMIGL